VQAAKTMGLVSEMHVGFKQVTFHSRLLDKVNSGQMYADTVQNFNTSPQINFTSLVIQSDLFGMVK